MRLAVGGAGEVEGPALGEEKAKKDEGEGPLKDVGGDQRTWPVTALLVAGGKRVRGCGRGRGTRKYRGER